MRRSRFFAAVGFLLLAILVGAAPAGEPFHGNTRTRVFHQASCRYYSCPNCTASFATAREAVERGYRPCGSCEPVSVTRDKPSAEGAAYVGNTNSHKFHRGSCRYAGCPNCTARFKTREEALKAGYAPGGCCSP